MRQKIYEWLKKNPGIKKKLHHCIVLDRTRPRWWVRNLLMPFIIKKGRGAYISPKVRRDLYPFHDFVIGCRSIVEDYATLENGMGSIRIGYSSRIGIGSVILGEITIGNNVSVGQHCILSGLNHNYESSDILLEQQGCYTDPIVIEDDVVTGANVVILPGVKIGTHSFISAGSVVTRHVPPYSLVSGNPARVTFDFKAGKRVNIK